MPRTLSCRKSNDLLPLYVGGDLPRRQLLAMEEHLKGCLPCFREYRSYTEARARLAALADAAPPAGILDGFTEEVMARVAMDEPGPAATILRPGASPWYAWPRLVAAAAILIAAIGAVRLVDDEGRMRGAQAPTMAPPTTTVSGSDGVAPARSRLAPPQGGLWAGSALTPRPANARPPQGVSIDLEGRVMLSEVERLFLEAGRGPARLHILRAGTSATGLQPDDRTSPRPRQR